MPRTHRWRQGDSIFDIAARSGFRSPFTVWNSPENAELRALRASPFALEPGDVLVIPDHQDRREPASTGARHVFYVVPTPLLALFARNNGRGAPPAQVPPVFAAPGETRVDPSFLLQLGAALKRVAATTSDYRIAVAGRSAAAEPALLTSALRLIRGEREAWLADAGARAGAADHQAMLAWAANVLGYPSDPLAIDGDFGPASRVALRRFRFAGWKALAGDPPTQGDFGAPDLEAFHALFERQLAKIGGVTPDELPALRKRLTPADEGIGDFDDRDPIGGDEATSGLDVLLVDEQNAKRIQGPFFADLKRPDRFAFAALDAEPALEEFVIYVLEFVDFEDVHFETDHFLLLPVTAEPEPAAGSGRDPGGLDAVAAALDHARKHPKRRVLVAGHTDPPGDRKANLTLSEKRANSVYFVLQGYGWMSTWIDLAQEKVHFPTVRIILRWVADTFGYPCAPDDKPASTPDPVALKAFRDAYNREVRLRRLTQVNPFTPGFQKEIPTGAAEPPGYPGRDTWRAFFEFYQRYLVHALDPEEQTLDQAGLAAIQDAMKFVEPFPTVGCGEFHTTDLEERPKRRLAGFPDLAGPARAADRRVEIVFFDPDELPDFACHGTAADHPCFPERCNLYDERLYRFRRIPPAGPEPWADVWYDRVEIDHVDDFAWLDDRMFLPRLGEAARFFVRIRKLRTPFAGKVRLTLSRSAKDGFKTVAVLEQELRQKEAPSGDIWVEFPWDGRATVAVPRHLSGRTVFDSNDQALVNIPLREIDTGKPVWHGVYEVEEVALLEKDDSLAGRDRPETQRRLDNAAIVPVLVLLYMSGEFQSSLNLLGFGPDALRVPYLATIREGILRQCRSKYADVGVRFVVRDGPSEAAKAALFVHFTDAVFDFGSFLMGSTDGRFTGPGVTLHSNEFVWKDVEKDPQKCLIGIVGGIFVRNQSTSDPVDRAAIREVFVPLGVAPDNRIEMTDPGVVHPGGPQLGDEGQKWAQLAPVQPRQQGSDGAVSGMVTDVDEGSTTVTLDVEGLPTVVSTNPSIVPPARARDIQRGLRAIIALGGTIAAHELGHWLGASTTRAPDSGAPTSIDVPPTVLAPHNQDPTGHNRVPSQTGLMDQGDTKSLRALMRLDDVVLTFNAEQRAYLFDCLPNE